MTRLPATAKIPYGGDYNPEQWPESVWEQDYALFDAAGIDTVTLGVFTWALTQPAPERVRLHRAGPHRGPRRRGRSADLPGHRYRRRPAVAGPGVSRGDPHRLRGAPAPVRAAAQLLPEFPGIPPALRRAGPPDRRPVRREPGCHRVARGQRVRRRVLLRAVRGPLPGLAANQVLHFGQPQRGLVHHLLVAPVHRLGRDRAAVRADRALARPGSHRFPGHDAGLSALHVRRHAGQLPGREGGHPRVQRRPGHHQLHGDVPAHRLSPLGLASWTSPRGTTTRRRTPIPPGWR